METIIAACITALATIIASAAATLLSKEKPSTTLDVINSVSNGCEAEKMYVSKLLLANEEWKLRDGMMHVAVRFCLYVTLFVSAAPLLLWLINGIVSSLCQGASLADAVAAGSTYTAPFLLALAIVSLGLVWLGHMKRRDIANIMSSHAQQLTRSSGNQDSLQEDKGHSCFWLKVIAMAISSAFSIGIFVCYVLRLIDGGFGSCLLVALCFVPFVYSLYKVFR